MVRGLRRSCSRVVCFLRMPSAMIVTGVSEHTSVAQLATTSSSVSSSLANSLRDHELDKHHEQKLHGETQPQVSCIWPNCPPPEARRGLAKSQGQSIWKSGQICRVSKYTIQEYTQEEKNCRKDGQGYKSRLPQFSLNMICVLKTPGLEDGLTP